MVLVKGTLYKGKLTGYGTYTDLAGNDWSASFFNDLKHGTCKSLLASNELLESVFHFNGKVEISDMYTGLYHGLGTFYCADAKILNQRNVVGEQG